MRLFALRRSGLFLFCRIRGTMMEATQYLIRSVIVFLRYTDYQYAAWLIKEGVDRLLQSSENVHFGLLSDSAQTRL